MEKLGLNELRERFLKFFESKGHLRLPSFSLIPQNDPSLLLINSGMAPLKPYLPGRRNHPEGELPLARNVLERRTLRMWEKRKARYFF